MKSYLQREASQPEIKFLYVVWSIQMHIQMSRNCLTRASQRTKTKKRSNMYGKHWQNKMDFTTHKLIERPAPKHSTTTLSWFTQTEFRWLDRQVNVNQQSVRKLIIWLKYIKYLVSPFPLTLWCKTFSYELREMIPLLFLK